MTTLCQLAIIRKKIDELDAMMLKTDEAVAATQSTTEIDFLRNQLVHLHKEKIVLCEQDHFAAR